MNIRRRIRQVLPGAALVAAVGIVFTAGSAHAASWESYTFGGDKANDPGGKWATSALDRDDLDTDGFPYYSYFDPYGEVLTVSDKVADGHAARAEVLVYNVDGDLIDSDKFYVGTADGYVKFNLGTPDGSGDIKEGLSVWIRVCINETSTCSSYMGGVA